MPRPPMINSKTVQLVLIPKPGQEEKLRWFKKWCILNDREISEVLFEKVEEMAKIHGFPDSRSQTTLEQIGLPKTLPLYKTCQHSRKEKVKGEFYCECDTYKIKKGWKIPDACTRCNQYRST